ncbi:hypothetical protein RJ640_025745 [Escallonia rubra]|uniref:Uncharacterized protein n=1 Tax=Escallonia rubra TaxID=112253 RepID=A0AA88RTT3_9ASTE|nr:hypothetical protein RJ640_025745 [Escallonia rubra]
MAIHTDYKDNRKAVESICPENMEDVRFLFKRIACLFLLLQLFWAAKVMAFKVDTIAFGKGFNPLFGHGNLVRSSDDKTVHLHLNQYTGMGSSLKLLFN